MSATSCVIAAIIAIRHAHRHRPRFYAVLHDEGAQAVTIPAPRSPSPA
ncbi:hypothetical protein LC55x_1556 [Lysobacter capsici]|nr:hypothetical protein LC55x_1556 [Lysobacter capsici]